MFNDVFPKIVPFMKQIWKNTVTATEATDDNTAHAHCMVDN